MDILDVGYSGTLVKIREGIYGVTWYVETNVEKKPNILHGLATVNAQTYPYVIRFVGASGTQVLTSDSNDLRCLEMNIYRLVI